MKLVKTQLFNLLGCLSFLVGLIGAFLPILPTTPLVLLASYFFSKGSPKFHNWLINLKYFGKKIQDWEEHGVIDLKSKIFATLILVGVWITIFYTKNYELWLLILLGFIFSLIILFINTRPSRNRT
jgi:hypothetical protein